jgi:hypothetical protein
MPVLILLIVIAGCKKTFTDLPLNGVETFDNRKVFETKDGIVSFVYGCYFTINYDDWWQTQWMRAMLETATDNSVLANLAQWGNASGYKPLAYFEGLNGDNGDVSGFWERNYRGVNRCNFGLANIRNAPAGVLDDALKTRLMAELRFLRAYFYMDLVKNFGDVVLNDENTVLNNTPRPRTDKAKVWDFIIADLSAAAQTLPQRKDYATPEDKGRASKGSALAYMAYAYLWREDWSNAEKTAKQLIDLNEYSLEQNYRNIYKPRKYNGQESIFEVGSNDDRGSVMSVVAGASRSDGGWGWHQPSSNLDQAFVNEGDSIRRVATVIRHGESAAEVADPTIPATGYDAVPSQNTSGRTFRKFYIPRNERNPANQAYGPRWQPMPYIFMRYAHVLLMYAEALAQQQKTTEAMNALNAVRARVSLLPKTGLSGEALMDAIVNERRLEFAGEFNNTRWDDIRRIKKNGKPLIDLILGPTGTFIQYNATSTDIYESRPGIQEPIKDKGKLFRAGVNELLPIPTVEIQSSNGVVKQNPGY